jgi:hypothetical protein
MKKILLAFLSFTAVSAFAADSPYDGDPVLPPPALATHFDAQAAAAELTEGLSRIKGIYWEEPPAGDVLEDAIEFPSLDASLLMEPVTKALPGIAPPRPCTDVRHERHEVHDRINRVAELRAEIEARLDRASRACARSPSGSCRTGSIDAPLGELNAQISKLRDYAEREAASTADRSVEYRFHLDGAVGLASLRQGWRPVGAGVLSRVRFPRGPWQPSIVLGAEGGLDAPPMPLLNGTWIVSRTLTATHACATFSVFNLEFHSGWQKNPAPVAGANGTALPNAALPLETVLIKGIAL